MDWEKIMHDLARMYYTVEPLGKEHEMILRIYNHLDRVHYDKL